jgi:transposase
VGSPGVALLRVRRQRDHVGIGDGPPGIYPSDTTDAEWEILGTLLPAPASTTATGGHPEAHPRREIVDAIRYVVDNGCKWRALPSDFAPFQNAGCSQSGPVAVTSRASEISG